jgi:tRNA/tmRNA/rRNA uracil-C5-methylase (TrmA/RlmC/RlmD family)
VTTVDFTLTGVVAGGDAIAREATGRVVFVRGGLPGEQVRAKIVEQKKDFARADVVEVVSASSRRLRRLRMDAQLGGRSARDEASDRP